MRLAMFGWLALLGAFMLFLGAHAIPMRPGIREPLTRVMGRRGYIAGFSLLSLLLLYLVILAANAAPFVLLWGPFLWSRWLVNLVMPVAILLGTFGVAAPNPFAVEGRKTGFDPERPGIAGLTRHPLMWAFTLWAGAHLIANGDLAHLLLFGPLLGFAVGGLFGAEARARRAPGFAEAAAHTSMFPGAALLTRRWRPRGLPSPWRLIVAVAIWGTLISLHPILIGVSPLP